MKLINCNKTVDVKTFEEASAIIRETIKKKNMGSAMWYYNKKNNGCLYDEDGRLIGNVSYNGRVWDNKGVEIK